MAPIFAFRTSLIAALALLAGLLALAMPAGAAAGGGRLDAALDRIIEDPAGPPGLSVLVQRGRHVDFRSRGVADRKTGAKPKIDSPMRIASMAKAFNGAIALSLASESRLGLDDTVGQWLPGVWPKADAVTVRAMLGHTAGLPDYIRQPAFIDVLMADPSQYLPPLDLIDFVNDLDVGLAPGESYEYSDSDNIMVGLIAEAATGRTYDQLLKRQIYRPVGIRNTSLPETLAMPKGYMHGYDRNDQGRFEDVSKFINPALAWASGGIVSTPADVNRFFRAYVGGELVQRQGRPEPEPVRPRPLLAPRSRPQRRHAGPVPLPHPLRDRLRAHGLLPRLPPVRGGERRRQALGRLLGQLPDRPRAGLTPRQRADPPRSGRRGLSRAPLTVERRAELMP